MSVKYAVLGLLAQRRGYGYDLVRRFSEQVGPAWQLKAGAIYVALDKLEQEGLVRQVTSEDGSPLTRQRTARGAPRVTYEATPEGIARFEQWMTSCSPMAPLREELHLKLALAGPANLPRLIELTEEQERTCLERLDECMGSRSFDQLVSGSQALPEVARGMVRDAEVAHLHATVDWLRRVREALRWMQEQPALQARD